MPGNAYPEIPLFRYDWSALSEAQIASQLDAVSAQGPVCATDLDLGLAGKTMQIVTDNGPTLSYRFGTGNRLALIENGAEPANAGYGALVLDHVTLFAHLVPGTMRGFAVWVDNATRLATVFELWFGGHERKREVMREIWQGYVYQDGAQPPKKRHVTTNRVEGKALYWKQDAGHETLEFFPSASYSHWVELSRMDGKRGYCAPSDYIAINEDKYIYTRTECEFSGIFTAYAMDLNRLTQIGLRIGFNAADELEFYIFRGSGEWLGQIAKFEEFGDTSGAPVPPPSEEKGARRVYRPLETMPKMTPAQVREIVAEHTKVFDGPGIMAGNGTEPSGALAGKEMTLHYDDGPVMEYVFATHDELRWRKDGQGGWTTARYNAWESMPGAFIFGHKLDGEADHDSHIVVADFDNGQATCFNGFLNTPYFANEAGARVFFGKIEAKGVPDAGANRHDYTADMLGRCMTWNYSPGLTSMHLYSTPYTTSWIIFTPSGAGGTSWAGSGAHVKIRDGLYFIYWLEEACNGTLGTILVNMRTMHDTGIGYHCGNEGLSISQVGALARHAGQFDVARFFEKRT